jgi:ketosteroid isomerase-like protein
MTAIDNLESEIGNLDVAERLFAAIMAGEVEAVRELYAPDVVIWHNFDQVEQTRDENLRTLAWVVKNVRDLRYQEIRRHAIEGGFVQQHVLRGVGPSGNTVEIPACIVCRVEDGKITRLDEYLDSAQTASLR